MNTSNTTPNSLNAPQPFDLNPTEMELKALVHKFAEQKIKPVIREDRKHHKFRKSLFKEMGDLGLTSILGSPQYGGLGLGYATLGVVLQELSKYSSDYAATLAVSYLPAGIIERHGSVEQKQKYLEKLYSGQYLGAFGLTEPGSGSDAASLTSKAVKKGDTYILNGTKQFITSGSEADVIVVFARTSDLPKSKGISAFIVTPDLPGFKIGKIEEKMGWDISPTAQLVFEDCQIPSQNIIGLENQGFAFALEALDPGRINISWMGLGLMEAAIKQASDYAQIRQQFGKHLIENQGLQFMLADMVILYEASLAITRKAALAKDAGQNITRLAASTKCFVTDSAMKVTTDAVQMLGGYGYTKEYDVEQYMRDAKVLQIVEGTNQIQRVVVARTLLQPKL